MLTDDQIQQLSAFTDAQLLAEVDRRAQGCKPPEVHYFGVWPGHSAGHHRRTRSGKTLGCSDNQSGRKAGLYPWVYWQGAHEPETEGLLWHWHHPSEPLTLLLSWDRSADQRGGCASTFIVHAHVTPEHALVLARENFPAVFARIEAHLGRPMQLAGEVPAC